MTIAKKFGIGLSIVLILLLIFLWLLWGPDSWEVQVTGVTGDGRNIQYRIETVYTGTADTLIFRNEDTGFWPPYFKFDSANLQSEASRISRTCPNVPVTVNGYGFRVPWLDLFPNATSIEAPERCVRAPSGSAEPNTGAQSPQSE